MDSDVCSLASEATLTVLPRTDPRTEHELFAVLGQPAVFLTRDFKQSLWQSELQGIEYAVTTPDDTRVGTIVHRGRAHMYADVLSADGLPLAKFDLRHGGSQGFVRVLGYGNSTRNGVSTGAVPVRMVGEIKADLFSFRSKYNVFCTGPSGASEPFGRLTVKAASTHLHIVDDHKNKLASIQSVPFAMGAHRSVHFHRFKIECGDESMDQRIVTLALAFVLDCTCFADADVTYT
ncbi:hypothetical protein MBRA1_003645 [Malassezia brasiliensis]|uniref:Phospholipid scramblase n=1 Tax=Malassezia brasiliensis TaxID=1821822 RepID=A0AAF0DX23_9BASI|nr:hypothetical protein MBRA1_003645 [Malassezia brasiliensis]